jgi:hypothetical protein
MGVSSVARISRTVVDSLRAELDLLGSAGVVAPELAELVRGRETRRLERQEGMAAYLAEAGALRPGLDATAARDILWALTGQELYRLLVLERGWNPDRYEARLPDLLISALLAPERANA